MVFPLLAVPAVKLFFMDFSMVNCLPGPFLSADFVDGFAELTLLVVCCFLLFAMVMNTVDSVELRLLC